MKWHITTYFLSLTLLTPCMARQQSSCHDFDITGAWMLISLTDQDGNVEEMDFNNYTRCKIYDSDSIYYSIELKASGDETIVIPHELAHYTLCVTPDDTLYIENGRVTQFQIIDDSTMTTVWDGYIETMRRSKTISDSRKKEIRDIVSNHQNENGEILRAFILSTSERRLKSTIKTYHYFLIILLLFVLLIASFMAGILRRKREAERNLQAIKEEMNTRPTLVANAIQQVEHDFFHSDYYLALQSRIAAGENMSDEDWHEMERQLGVVYSGFSRKLRSLYDFSDTEFHVCLLLKLRATNKDIAAVIKRAPDSVSSIRNRLHKKVLGPDGGAREWDEFILSL